MRRKRIADKAADGIAWVVAALVVGTAAGYPVVYAAETGTWWLVALVVGAVGAAGAALYAGCRGY